MAELVSVGDDHDCCPRCTVRGRYLRTLADLLGLRDWLVEVDHEPAQDGALATVTLHSERRQLRVRYSLDYDREPEDEQRYGVVHELVHAHLRDLYETVTSATREEMSGAAYRVFVLQVRRDIERTVDSMAGPLAESVPLPSEVRG